MTKEEKLNLNHVIDRCIRDNTGTLFSNAAVIGLRELLLDAIEEGGYEITALSSYQLDSKTAAERY